MSKFHDDPRINDILTGLAEGANERGLSEENKALLANYRAELVAEENKRLKAEADAAKAAEKAAKPAPKPKAVKPKVEAPEAE